MEKKIKKEKIDRREFLKRLGAGAAVSAVALSGCRPKRNPASGDRSAQGEVPTDKMTYRTNPTTGDRVSLLGYGCMRWPTVADSSDEQIDQQMVNSLVDYAIAHGVKAGDIIRNIAPIVGGKGGGKPDSAMGGGTDVLKVDDALAAVDDFVAANVKE